MPTQSVTSVPHELSTRGAWVLLEEVWREGFWVDSNRELQVPAGVRVSLRHNFIVPPWHWEVGLGEGRHGFYIVEGWNKFQVRLDSAAPTVVSWIL